MSHKHYTIKNKLGGCFCKKCFQWSSATDGLKDMFCEVKRFKKKKLQELKGEEKKNVGVLPVKILLFLRIGKVGVGV